jgi:lincosamide nucleotidyltransferase A/C/D/E
MQLSMMKKEDVIQVLAILADAGIEVIVGGGWAVDTVLGQQTREHQDLDIAILHKDVPDLRKRLAENGFGEIPVDDSWMCNFLLEDAQGRRVDVHSCTFDEKRRNIFGVKYPIESWQGSD